MFDDGATWEIGLAVHVQGEVVECTTLAEAAALRKADQLLMERGRYSCDPHETAALAVALSRCEHFKIARQLNILADIVRLNAGIGLQLQR